MKVFGTLVIAVLALAPAAFAQSLKETKSMKFVMEELNRSDFSFKDDVKKNCGIDLKVEVDPKVIKNFLENPNGASGVEYYCNGPMQAMALMCEEDPENKKAIAGKIKSISCKNGESGKHSFKISGSTLEATFGPGADNLYLAAKEFLENNL